jgi:3-oxoacyl-[acyl-carrier-protein] synthase-3
MWQNFDLIGTGLYLPRQQWSAEEIDQRAGMPPGWTRKHVGVLNRHECAAQETLGSMARQASTAAMRAANLDWPELDLIIDGSTCRHQPVPFNAVHVQSHLGPAAQAIACMDVHSTCLGFVLALHVANSLLATEAYRHILIVCSEAGLAGVNWREPESACLVGDAATAVVLRRSTPKPTYHFAHETYSTYLDACHIRGGCHNLPPYAYCQANDADYRFHMDGPLLFRAACKHLPTMTDRVLTASGVAKEGLHVIPHQASPRALEIIRRLLRFERERFHDRVAGLGNLAAASIPAVLHQCRTERVITPGDTVLLLGTSAGYSQAVALFQV